MRLSQVTSATDIKDQCPLRIDICQAAPREREVVYQKISRVAKGNLPTLRLQRADGADDHAVRTTIGRSRMADDDDQGLLDAHRRPNVRVKRLLVVDDENPGKRVQIRRHRVGVNRSGNCAFAKRQETRSPHGDAKSTSCRTTSGPRRRQRQTSSDRTQALNPQRDLCIQRFPSTSPTVFADMIQNPVSVVNGHSVRFSNLIRSNY